MKYKLLLFILLLPLVTTTFGKSGSFLREEICLSKQIVRLGSNALKDRVLKKIAPVFPKGCRCKGKVTAYLVVGKEGKVEKVTTGRGNPLLRVSVIQATREWTFEPLKRGDKKVCFSGKIDFFF